MLSRLAMLAVIAAGIYWYYTGPYQDQARKAAGLDLTENAKIMKRCIDAEKVAQGTGLIHGTPEEVCAKKYDLYFEDGKWYSYKTAREN